MSYNGWKEYRLDELVESVSVKHEFKKDKIILVNTSDVLEGKVLNHEYVKNKNLKGQFKKSFIKGDILYSEIRPKNKRFAFVDFDAKDYVASTKLMVLRRKNANIDNRYLYYVVTNERFISILQNLAETRSGTFPQITFNELGMQKVKIPKLKEQKAIAHILSTLDEKIEVNNRINKTLENMAQAIFKHWFVDFEFPNEEGEPYKSSGGEMVESELGMIPKGWEVGTIQDIGDVVGGATPSRKIDKYFVEKGIPWITPKDLSENKNMFISRGALDITEEAYKSTSVKKMPKGTVLFSSRAPIG
ncbi:type I restriction enzyme, S subunit [Proteiniborus ethanoligenes]|uniref:Type I restriction enzyme, S subunit n=1 Tax=Proteiniborus ethanoligenes TaxID=415015 RepID=A0A1H3SJQ5_9FIRM|nr:restriction endonuclease subunit S [Proteiniborus ethanoligenes]SDZ37339.1 type I restriction enzyme, S subunit [Proteiniborus ethanoligenes]